MPSHRLSNTSTEWFGVKLFLPFDQPSDARWLKFPVPTVQHKGFHGCVVCVCFFFKNLTTFTTQLLTVGNLFCKLFRSVGVCCIVCLIRVKIYPLRWGEVGLDGWRRADSKQEEDPTYGSNVQVLEKTFSHPACAALPGKAAHVPEVFEFLLCCRCCCCPSPCFSVPCIGQEIQLLTFEGFTRETIRQWHSECVQITMYSFLRQIPQCDSQLCAIILQRMKFGEGRGSVIRSAALLAHQFRSPVRAPPSLWHGLVYRSGDNLGSFCRHLPCGRTRSLFRRKKCASWMIF